MAFPQSISPEHIEAKPDCAPEHKSYAIFTLDPESGKPDEVLIIFSTQRAALAELQSRSWTDNRTFLLARLGQDGSIAKKLTVGGKSRVHERRLSFAGVLEHQEAVA